MEALAPIVLIGIFGLLLVARLLTLKKLPPGYLATALVCISLFCLGAYLDEDLRLLKLYPMLVNAGAALYGMYTLFYPPSAIERLTRMLGTPVEGPAVAYTRVLTLVWVVFFVGNGIMAAYTALAASTAIWTIYNGLISYLLIGLLFAVEYPVRIYYRKLHGHDI